MSLPTFEQVLEQVVKPEHRIEGYLICLDPGETTGYCIFHEEELIEAGELKTPDVQLGMRAVKDLIEKPGYEEDPIHIICESYRVYSWKAKDHANSSLHTPQLIGAIKTLCELKHIPYNEQSAHQAKGFADDNKLREWGFWIKGKRHARDAIRHGIHYILFTYPKQCKEREDDARRRNKV